MVFAIAKLDSADKWVPIWLPFVIVGVGLSLFGVIVARRKHVSHTDIR
jgi:cyanate permease